MVTNHHNVGLRIELLIEARRNIAHRDGLAARHMRRLVFPGLTNVEQHNLPTCIEQRLQFCMADFVIHAIYVFPHFGRRFSM